VGHFKQKFQMEGGVDHQAQIVSENYSYGHSSGIKISAVYCLVLSQNMRVTGQTELRQLIPHHMVIKPFILLGRAAKYRSRRWMW